MASPGPTRFDYIRFFATTDDSALGLAALEYGKSICRVAPVRLITMSGALSGAWSAFGELMGTPMVGVACNAVCCDPSRWIWSLKVPAPDKPVTGADLSSSNSLDPPSHSHALNDKAPGYVVKKPEFIDGVRELYTPGIRNVLFAVATPRSALQLESAEKYDEIVVPTGDHIAWWIQVSTRLLRVVPTPVTMHDQVRLALGVMETHVEGPYR